MQRNPASSAYALTKAIPSALRALRNIGEAAADVCLGRMWGVEVVAGGTNGALVNGSGTGASERNGGEAGRAVAKRWGQDDVKRMAKGVVVGMFEVGMACSSHRSIPWRSDHGRPRPQPAALSTLVPLMTSSIPSPSRLPLYQLYAHLTVLPSHRHALAALAHPTYRPRTIKHPRVQLASSPHAAVSLDALAGQLTHQIANAGPGPLVEHLCETILGVDGERQANAKVTAAALDLLSAMCRDETATALEAIVAVHRGSDREVQSTRD